MASDTKNYFETRQFIPKEYIHIIKYRLPKSSTEHANVLLLRLCVFPQIIYKIDCPYQKKKNNVIVYAKNYIEYRLLILEKYKNMELRCTEHG